MRSATITPDLPPVQDANDSRLVYLADRGNTYHADRGCPKLGRVASVYVLPAQRALDRGRLPCRVCTPTAEGM